MGRRTAGALLVAIMLAFGTACGSSTSGTPTPATTDRKAATAALWDPCTQVTDDTIRKIGADPATRESGVGGVQVTGWKACSWDFGPEKDRSVTVWASTFTLDDMKKKSDNVDFVEISAAGRNGWRFRRISDKRNEDCDLVFPGVSGSYQISYYNLTESITASPCDGVMNAANIVVPLFPK